MFVAKLFESKFVSRASGTEVTIVPLQGLADEIVSLSHNRQRTPVLVTPRYLSVRNRFLVELLRELAGLSGDRSSRTGPVVRLDWLCNTSLWRQRIARLRANRINAMILRDSTLQGRAEVFVAASIGRREQVNSPLVLGLCDEDQDLPNWALKIQLSGAPQHQASPVTRKSLKQLSVKPLPAS